MNSTNYYRIKTECIKEMSDGRLRKDKIEELVLATSYTEAEALATELCRMYNRDEFGDISHEIIKTKISDVLYNLTLSQEQEKCMGFVGNIFSESEDSGVGLYSVKVVFITIDEKNGNEKKTPEVFYVPATSNADATTRISTHLKNSVVDYVIRDTKFDPAEAIYWPEDVHHSKVEKYQLSGC